MTPGSKSGAGGGDAGSPAARRDPLIAAIENHRQRRGLGVYQLATRAHAHQRTWYRVLANNSATLPTLHAFAAALGLAIVLIPLGERPSNERLLMHVDDDELVAELARRLAAVHIRPGPSTGPSTGEGKAA